MYLNGTKCRLLVLSCLASASLIAKDIKSINATGLQKPICFIENKGQVHDMQYRQRPDVDYKLAAHGLDLYVGAGELHYQFKQVKMDKDAPEIKAYQMDVVLEGANKYAKPEALNQQSYYENYYVEGAAGVTAHSYNKVIYKNIYPNIDWIVYVKDGKVEYDFSVRPGGNVRDIKIKYEGATDLAITKDGGLKAATPMGEVVEGKPYTYESVSHKKVTSRFTLNGNTVGFETGTYAGAITIDPFVRWSRYVGGAAEDVATGIKSSITGEVFVSGYSASTGIATTGAFQTTNNGGLYDAFLAKYDSFGTLQWATYAGGTGSDVGNGVAINNGGFVYLVGTTTSATIPSFTGVNSGGSDIFLMRLSKATGILGWARFYGGTSNDFGTSVACEHGTGSTIGYIGGATTSTGIASAGAYQTLYGGSQDGYVARFTTTSGNITWQTYYGGGGTDIVNGMMVDISNRLNVAGSTTSASAIASTGAYQTALSGSQDGFVAQFTAIGARNWGTYYGGSGSESINGVAIDRYSNIYITGETNSSDGIARGYSTQSGFAGGANDAFLARLTSGGAMRWGTYFGGEGDEKAYGVCADFQANVSIAGVTGSNTGIATDGAYQGALGGGTDAFVAKYDTMGRKYYGTYYGVTGNEIAYAVISDSVGSGLEIVGSATSAGLNTIGSAFAGGTSDGFITRLTVDTLVTINEVMRDTVMCAGNTFTIRDSVNYSFSTGNIFTVQLSDATGSFAAPVTIGTVSATTKGNITCTIPTTVPDGAGYRIRIMSSSPLTYSPVNTRDIRIYNTLPTGTISVNTPVCEGGTANFTFSLPYSVTSYSWSGPTGFSSVIANPSRNLLTFADGGVYTVTTTSPGCPNAVHTVSLYVNNVYPPAPIVGSNSPICEFGTLNLTADPDTTAMVTYFWSGPSGFTSNLQNPSVTGVTSAGTYTVVDTFMGCPSPASSVTIVVNPLDTANISISVSPNDTVCAGTMVTFTASTTMAGTSPTFQWMNGTSPVIGAVFSTYASPFLSNGDNIYCIMAASATGVCLFNPIDTSNVITMNIINNTPVISIHALPDTVVSPGTTVTFISTVLAGSVSAYQWYKNGTPVIGATSSTYTLPSVTAATSVRLEVTSAATCAGIGVSNTVGIHMPSTVGYVAASLNSIELYPNPNSGAFTLEGIVSNGDETLQVSVTNALGQTMYQHDVKVSNGKVSQNFNLNELPSGIYLLHVSNADGGKTIKFVKE